MNFFLLRLDQIDGDNCLSIFKKMGYGAKKTDFANLIGGKASDWWTMTPASYGPIAIQGDDYHMCKASWDATVGVRPAIKYSTISHLCKNKKQNDSGVTEVEFGEYPCSMDKDSESLRKAYYFDHKMTPTGKNYRIVNPIIGYGFQTYTISYPEYQYNGKKYIEIESSRTPEDNSLPWTDNGRIPKTYFLNVKPIVWLVDEEADIAISKDIIFSDVKFNPMSGYYKLEDYDDSFMKLFMNEVFAEDIRTPDMPILKENNDHKKIKSR